MLFKALLSVALLVGSFSAVAGPTTSRAEREVQSRKIKQWLNPLVLNEAYKSLESLNLRVENFVDHDATLEHFFFRALSAHIQEIEQKNTPSEFTEQKHLWNSLNLRDQRRSSALTGNSRFLTARIAEQMLKLAQIQLALTMISDHLLLKDPAVHTTLIHQIRKTADGASKKITSIVDQQLLLLISSASPLERPAILNAVSNLGENFWLLHFKTLGASTAEMTSLDILADLNDNLILHKDKKLIDIAIKASHDNQRFDIKDYMSKMESSHLTVRAVIYSSLLFFTFLGAQNIPGVIPGLEATYDSFVSSLQPFTGIDALFRTHFSSLHSFFTSAGFQKLVHDTLYSSAEGLKLQGHEDQLFWATIFGMGTAGLEKLIRLPTIISQRLELRRKERELRRFDDNPNAVSESFNQIVISLKTSYEKYKAKYVEDCEAKLQTHPSRIVPDSL